MHRPVDVSAQSGPEVDKVDRYPLYSGPWVLPDEVNHPDPSARACMDLCLLCSRTAVWRDYAVTRPTGSLVPRDCPLGALGVDSKGWPWWR